MIDVQSRLTERVNRARLKLELKRSVKPALIVACGAAIAAVFASVIFTQIRGGVLPDTHEVRFAVDTARAVVPGRQQVRFRGIPAGTITKVELVGAQPVITATIRKEYGQIYRNARAALRPATPLQDMYLDILDRGTPAAGVPSSGAPIPEANTATSVDVAEVLNTFRPGVRGRLTALLDNLGNGIGRRGDALRTAFNQAVPLLEVAGRATRQLSARRPMTRRLVHNLAVLTEELGARDRQLRTLVRDGGVALRTLAAGAPDLDATLHELPSTLATLDSSFAAVRGVLGDVDRAVVSLYPVARELPGSLTALRELSEDAEPAVRALRAPVRRLMPLAQTLSPLARDLDTSVRTLLPTVDTIDRFTRNLAACERGIEGFFHYDASMGKFGDIYGSAPRGNSEWSLAAGGTVADPRMYAPQACVPGAPVGGRPVSAEDKH